MSELTPKQAEFCRQYIIDLNGTQAYLRAGYKGGEKTAATNAGKLLGKAEIQDEINRLRKLQQQRTEVTADRVVRELGAIAFTTLRDVADWDSGSLELKPAEELTQAQAAAIQSISITPTKMGNSIKISMHSKDSAIEKLGRFLGCFGEMNSAIAILKTYGIELAQVDGEWKILEDKSQ